MHERRYFLEGLILCRFAPARTWGMFDGKSLSAEKLRGRILWKDAVKN